MLLLFLECFFFCSSASPVLIFAPTLQIQTLTFSGATWNLVNVRTQPARETAGLYWSNTRMIVLLELLYKPSRTPLTVFVPVQPLPTQQLAQLQLAQHLPMQTPNCSGATWISLQLRSRPAKVTAGLYWSSTLMIVCPMVHKPTKTASLLCVVMVGEAVLQELCPLHCSPPCRLFYLQSTLPSCS